MREVALMVKNTFLVNVTLNKDRRITGVFAGDIITAHGVGCDFVRLNSMINIDGLFDVVVTSNSGYLLDQNLYQCVKGLAAAKRACRKRGQSSWSRSVKTACRITGSMLLC